MLQLPLVFAFKQILVHYFFILSVAQTIRLLRSLEVLPRFLFRLDAELDPVFFHGHRIAANFLESLH